jgi:hypothetical protein
MEVNTTSAEKFAHGEQHGSERPKGGDRPVSMDEWIDMYSMGHPDWSIAQPGTG